VGHNIATEDQGRFTVFGATVFVASVVEEQANIICELLAEARM
jgi:hypothetical protein